MGTMKIDGAHNLFRIQDVRRYPLFYIELLYVFFNLFGIVALIVNEGIGPRKVPADTSPVWEIAASYSGILLLVLFAAAVTGLGVYGLFWGGFKWRARHMFLQFLLRLYVTIGALSIYGFYPTTWMNSAFLALVASVMYLKLKWESNRWEAYLNDAGH